MRKPTSFRLSERTLAQISTLCQILDTGRTSVVERAIATLYSMIMGGTMAHDTRTVTLVTTVSGNDAITRVAPATEEAGVNADASRQVTVITNVPADVPDAEVLRRFNTTANLTPIYGRPRYVLEFAELGEGKLIKD